MSGIARYKSVGLDSNVFIYHFEENPTFTPFTDKLFTKLSDGRLKAVTSILTIAETLSLPTPPRVLNALTEAFATIPNVRFIDVNQEIAIEAARIRRSYKFRLPDAIHLATALHAKVKLFVTNDARLQQFPELKFIPLKHV